MSDGETVKRGVTPELLAEIETTGRTLLDGGRNPGLYSADARAYKQAANVYAVLALVARIRELEARLDEAYTDASHRR